MKKSACLLFILVIACCAAAPAQIKTSPAARAQVPANTHVPPVKPHRPAVVQSRWSFDFTGGPAFPIGQFAHTQDQNPVSGTVHTGSLFELSTTYHLSQRWGITLLAGRQYHNSDLDRQYLPFGLPAYPSPEMLALYDPQHWNMTRILAGGAYTLPLNRKQNLALLARILAGIEKVHASEYSYVADYPDWNGFSAIPAPNLPWVFSYQADAGLQWKPYRRWSLLALAGYNGCRPSATAPDIDKKIYFSTGSILLRAGVGFNL